MSSYTMELREYIESWSQDETLSVRDQIEVGRPKLFDFDYPIFDATYKKVFETHFIRRFYRREIGSETEGLFKFNLETWLLINMPYFNKLFQSELITFDPLTNTKVDVTQNKTNDKTQTSTSTTDGTSNSTQDGTNEQTSNSTVNQTENQTSSGTQNDDDFNRSIKSDTPDTRLNLTATDGEGLLEYASEIQENNANKSKTSSGESDLTNDTVSEKTNNQTTHATGEDVTNVVSTGSGTINEIEDFIENKFGKVGTQTFSSMVNEYRQSFLRIENQIFQEIEREGIFMLVY